jgi:DNA-binding PadR family transcriptional regulator
MNQVSDMAKRRKVSNLLALAVLSALAQRPMHPYEIATALRGWGKDQDMEIKWGSLYTVVRNMDKHGLIAAVESVREGRRPERTVYRITEAGRAELVDWARELVSTPVREHPRFRAGLSVLAVLHPDEAARLLRQRLDLLEDDITAARDALAQHMKDVPRLFLVESEYDLAMQEAEAAWIRSLLAELTSGNYPGLDAWRAFHETGEMPAELIELAERTSSME